MCTHEFLSEQSEAESNSRQSRLDAYLGDENSRLKHLFLSFEQ